jgi:endonuclease YncB( thermonuclease family)
MGLCVSNQAEQVEKVRRQQLEAATYSTADDLVYNFSEAKVVKVYDGDSLTIAAYYDNGIKKFNVRIYGIDCDEIKGGTPETRENAIRAKKYVEKLVLNKIVKVTVLNNRVVDGKKLREKYGRLLASIITPEGIDLADELHIMGLARRYYGESKEKAYADTSMASSASD